MKGFGMTLFLQDDPEKVALYKAHHRAVWPGVIAGLHSIGVEHMEIYLVGRRMFMHFSAPDDFEPARDFAALAEDPEYARWDELMRTFQERAPEAIDGEWWHPLEQVFDMDAPQDGPEPGR